MLVCVAWPPVSEDPAVSMILICGSTSINSDFSFAVKIAPPVMTLRNVGHLAPEARNASSRGRPKASPTSIRFCTPSRSMDSTTPAASKRFTSSWMTTVPPVWNAWNELQWPAPCMNGGAGRVLRWLASARATKPSRLSMTSPLVRRAPRLATRMSLCFQSTPFGIPVVPPV